MTFHFIPFGNRLTVWQLRAWAWEVASRLDSWMVGGDREAGWLIPVSVCLFSQGQACSSWSSSSSSSMRWVGSGASGVAHATHATHNARRTPHTCTWCAWILDLDVARHVSRPPASLRLAVRPTRSLLRARRSRNRNLGWRVDVSTDRQIRRLSRQAGKLCVLYLRTDITSARWRRQLYFFPPRLGFRSLPCPAFPFLLLCTSPPSAPSAPFPRRRSSTFFHVPARVLHRRSRNDVLLYRFI